MKVQTQHQPHDRGTQTLNYVPLFPHCNIYAAFPKAAGRQASKKNTRNEADVRVVKNACAIFVLALINPSPSVSLLPSPFLAPPLRWACARGPCSQHQIRPEDRRSAVGGRRGR